jgi:hypothetical protein
MAFERDEGPIGPRWQSEVMAATHEQLQRLNHLLGAAHFTDDKHKKNPVPKPRHYPRPDEIFQDPDREDQYNPDEDQMEEIQIETFGSARKDKIDVEVHPEDDDEE